MDDITPASPATDRLVKRPELQRALNVSNATIFRWMRDGKLPPLDVNITRENYGWKVSKLRNFGIDVL
jgi:predicted DNA-binding transcriptional regulator AlpA